MPEKFVCIHGHFYQPPRENAWTERVDRQPSAAPFHDWNERIDRECYLPNAVARIQNHEDFIIDLVNNYEQISFNFGPTLLSWMEINAITTYQKILEADKVSAQKFGGHGNAIAQVYSHLIMPLTNDRDRETQVIWGIQDFEYRFRRKPEGMWLAETAVDTTTLEILAKHGIRFTILAPGQARAVRPVGDHHWQPIHPDGLETRRPYWCQLPSGKKIALFFYNGAVAHDVAFNGVLHSGKEFSSRLLSSFSAERTENQLVHIATDGETYGHHHRFGEMALADCLLEIKKAGEVQITNYGQFLEKYPPTWEVLIHENTSWSCAHGVERWRANCGCHAGGQPGWTQIWRAPLRQTLDWLRDQLASISEQESRGLLGDVWSARNDFIRVVLDRKLTTEDAFLHSHAVKPINEAEKTKCLKIMEMQRHAMQMYTSCGWFFNEISGIETIQILQYAYRAIVLAKEVSGVDLKEVFLKKLEAIPSNKYPNARVVVEHFVLEHTQNSERFEVKYDSFQQKVAQSIKELEAIYERILNDFNRIKSDEFLAVPMVVQEAKQFTRRRKIHQIFEEKELKISELRTVFEIMKSEKTTYAGDEELNKVAGKRLLEIFESINWQTTSVSHIQVLSDALELLKSNGFAPDIWQLQIAFFQKKEIVKNLGNDELKRQFSKLGTILKVVT